MLQGRYVKNLIAEELRWREMEKERRRAQCLDLLDEGEGGEGW